MHQYFYYLHLPIILPQQEGFAVVIMEGLTNVMELQNIYVMTVLMGIAKSITIDFILLFIYESIFKRNKTLEINFGSNIFTKSVFCIHEKIPSLGNENIAWYNIWILGNFVMPKATF